MRLMVAWLSLLLGLETPDVCAGFQLRNILGVFVALVATPVRLRSLRDGWLVLLLGVALAGLEEHLLLLQDVGDLGGLAGEVEVLVNGLLNGRPSEGVVIEGVVGIVEAITEAIIRLFEVDAMFIVRKRDLGGRGATYTSSSPAPPLLSPAKASCWPKPGALDA